MIALNPDVVGLVRDVTHGMSDTTSKLTGTVSHVLGQATGDSSYQEEREQNLVSCQSSGDHFQAGLINLTGGLFGGVTSIITQPYKGAVEDGIGVSHLIAIETTILTSPPSFFPSPSLYCTSPGSLSLFTIPLFVSHYFSGVSIRYR